MPKIPNFLVTLLVIVCSTQVFSIIIPYYNIVDEILVLFISLCCLKHRIIDSKKSIDENLILLSLFFSISAFSVFLNFYSVIAPFVKVVLYIKILLVFIFILPLCSTMNMEQRRSIYYMILLLSLLGIIEYVYVATNNNVFFKNLVYLKYREGLYRAMSLTGHPISYGMMSFCGLFYSFKKRFPMWHILVFIASVIVSWSRIPITLSILYTWYNLTIILKEKYSVKYAQVLSIVPISALFIYLYNYVDLRVLLVDEANSIRMVAAKHSLQFWVEHPKYILLGTGIGSFGTGISVVHNSPVYNYISIPWHYFYIIKDNSASGVESFVIMSAVEMGMMGGLLFYSIILINIKKYMIHWKLFFAILIMYSSIYPMYTLPAIFLLVIFFTGSSSKLLPYSESPKRILWGKTHVDNYGISLSKEKRKNDEGNV